MNTKSKIAYYVNHVATTILIAVGIVCILFMIAVYCFGIDAMNQFCIEHAFWSAFIITVLTLGSIYGGIALIHGYCLLSLRAVRYDIKEQLKEMNKLIRYGEEQNEV